MGIIFAASCLLGCTEARVRSADANSAPSPNGASVSAPTAAAAYKQNWDCQRIERAIDGLVEPLRSAKSRAEIEESQIAATLARLIERLSGPPGAGNAALVEYKQLRGDTDQLNELLRNKKCASVTVDVGTPSFLPP